jgi:hypothetical protein
MGCKRVAKLRCEQSVSSPIGGCEGRQGAGEADTEAAGVVKW